MRQKFDDFHGIRTPPYIFTKNAGRYRSATVPGSHGLPHLKFSPQARRNFAKIVFSQNIFKKIKADKHF
jgi:hypothetical protein